MRYGIFLFFLFLQVFGAGAQEHQRLVVTPGNSPLFAADPLTNRYREGSLAAVAAFAEAWRTELGEKNLFLVDMPVRELSLGDRVYAALADSTLRSRVMLAVGYVPEGEKDSIRSLFGVTRGAVDSLGETEWLVADRYTVDGRAAVRVKRQDFGGIRPLRAFEERFAADEKRVRRFFLEPVAELDTTISTRDGFFGPSAFADWFHRFHFDVAKGAEVSFFAPPAMDATRLKGFLCLSDVLSLFRFDNQLVTVRLSGRQLKEFMEKVFGMRFFKIEGPQSDLVRLKVPYYLHDDVAGIRFRVDLTARYHHRVTIYETERGEKFDPERIYTVVLNSFRARDLVEMGLEPVVVAEDYRLALARWIVAHPHLSPRARDNWSAGPERWVRAIAERERRTIFERR
ncbi:5'-nucleotidase [uncultured Rikenella sp.]|uniref:5'-nucleotidase n=1 Tax=uncultured Rikenella sp. TaxID=368003 RepID=UPI002638EC56|nr:5'-nucleotidase [uncultured Rikenella sp.]